MSRVVADLHVHTTVSDGQLDLESVPAAAQRADLEAVAITDHDRVNPGFDRPIEERGGITVIRGIELKVELESGDRIDLLGYGIGDDEALLDLTERIQTERIERGAAIIDRVESHLGVSLDLSPHEGIGRPHIARAIVSHPAVSYDKSGVFAELIGDGCPCFVERWVPSLAEGRECLEGAGALVAVAHPLRYDDPGRAIEVAMDLGAVEWWYPYGSDVDRSELAAAIERHDLIPTGGSDAHDDRLGTTGPDRSAYDRFARACGMASPQR